MSDSDAPGVTPGPAPWTRTASARVAGDPLARWIEREEGRRLTPYPDTQGHLTIGVGRNLDANGLSHDEVDLLFCNDLGRAVAQAHSIGPWVAQLDEVRQAVVIGMVFQLGLAGTLKFRNTLGALAAGDWKAAAAQMLASRWAQQTPARVARCVAMVMSGRWPEGV